MDRPLPAGENASHEPINAADAATAHVRPRSVRDSSRGLVAREGHAFSDAVFASRFPTPHPSPPLAFARAGRGAESSHLPDVADRFLGAPDVLIPELRK